MADGQRELAHSWTYDRLDAYGERRDSERLKASNLSEWPIEQEVRIMGLPERWQGLRQACSGAAWIRCGLIRCSLIRCGLIRCSLIRCGLIRCILDQGSLVRIKKTP